MSELGSAIRQIRKRLNKTMVEFAGELKTTAATISRYESGKLLPSRAALLSLLGIAEGEERKAILDALGVDVDLREGWGEKGLDSALRTFEAYMALAPGRERKLRKSELLADFARTASAIVKRNETIEPGLVDILDLWLRHSRNPEARQFFRYVAVFLKAQLHEFEESSPSDSGAVNRSGGD